MKHKKIKLIELKLGKPPVKIVQGVKTVYFN